MQVGTIQRVRTDKDVQFIAAIAQNAADTANVVPPMSLASGGHCRSIIRGISVLSDQNLAWEVQFYSQNTFNTLAADLDQMPFLGKWAFAAADGLQVAGAGPFIYYIDGLYIPYHCTDFDYTANGVAGHGKWINGVAQPEGQFHIMLVNRSATGKSAGAAGEIVIQLYCEPSQGL